MNDEQKLATGEIGEYQNVRIIHAPRRAKSLAALMIGAAVSANLPLFRQPELPPTRRTERDPDARTLAEQKRLRKCMKRLADATGV